jgi:diguanylate cyclase (GGDEF)-like protein
MVFNEAISLLFYSGMIPVLVGHLYGRQAYTVSWGVTLGVMSLIWTFFLGPRWGHAVVWWLGYVMVGAVPILSQKILKEIRRHYTDRLEKMKNEKDSALREFDVLRQVQTGLGADLDRIQNRFALVQVMATKLEAEDILQTLGNVWKNTAGVKSSVLLRPHLNGKWSVAYADGVENPDLWADIIGEFADLAQARRIRRYTSSEKHPFFSKVKKKSSTPFFWIPFVWDRDTLAIGFLEADPAALNDPWEGFAIERKLVSLGLQRAALYELMRERSRHDALTGVFLRRVLMERLEEAIRKSRRYHTPLFFALLDVDHFKSLNDRWGHVLGDKVLTHLAQALQKFSHPGIVVGRFGGDEFAMVMETKSLDEAVRWLERIRQSVGEATVREGTAQIHYTLSIGISAFWPMAPRPEELIAQADSALYRAKGAGRNCVVVWSREDPRPQIGAS